MICDVCGKELERVAMCAGKKIYCQKCATKTMIKDIKEALND
jgi:DNA-directed RNA polymerase subunit RPC12/RpoP